MFTTVSMTGTGLVGLIITYIIGYFGYTANLSDTAGIATSILALVSTFLTYWGQLRRKDLDYGLLRN